MSHDLSPDDAQKAAAAWHADVGVEHVATVYAQAVLGAAEGEGQAASLLEEFDSLVGDVLDRFPALERLLGSALVSHDEKVALLERVLGATASPILMSSLSVISAHGRLDCLRAIHLKLHHLDDERRGRVRVTLTTAAPIDAALAAQVAAGLRRALGGEPVVECRADPALIGGAVVRVGDTVYDGSLATQLENVRKHMIDRSVHEIQIRRDRFRYPAGN